MIALERADMRQRRVDFVAVDSGPAGWREAFSRAARAAREVGLHDVRLQMEPSSADRGDSEAASALVPEVVGVGAGAGRFNAATERARVREARRQALRDAEAPDYPRHSWTLRAEGLAYETTFAHVPASRDLVAVYVPLMLATFGAQENDLMKLRVCIYELCANALEHGRPRALTAELRLSLQFHADRIEGSIQDGCERFDPTQHPAPTAARHAAQRERRGYGLGMIRTMLDSFRHEDLGYGNRLSFSKGVEA